jgi:glutathionylspermidine synthase
MLPRHADQFNSIDTRLHQAFAELQLKRPFYFASMKDSVEDKGTTDYLRLIAEKVGIESRHIDIEDIGLTADGRFVDLEDRWIPHLFKPTPGSSSSTNRSGGDCRVRYTVFRTGMESDPVEQGRTAIAMGTAQGPPEPARGAP